MLNLGKVSFVTMVVASFFSCQQQDKIDVEAKIIEQTSRILGSKSKYDKFYKAMSDTVANWYSSELLLGSQFGENGVQPCEYFLDSVFCVNSSGTRLSGILYQTSKKGTPQSYDDLYEFLGAKVDGRWYFWLGATQPIGRMNQNQPLSHPQLHSKALKMMSGYVTEDGKINDKWFDYFFEGPGWGSFNEYHKDSITIHGEVIHNEKEYHEYYYKMNGRGLWIKKAHDAYMKYKKEHGLE